MTMGEKIRHLRRDRHWTLKQLEERSRISASYISALEKGQRPTPSFDCIQRLCRAFGVPLDYFADETLPESTSSSATSEDEMNVLATIETLYDKETQAFIASESSRPYVDFARQLATEHNAMDPSHVLQLIAQFLRDQRQLYDDGQRSELQSFET